MNIKREQFAALMALINSGAHEAAQEQLGALRRTAPHDLNLLNLAAWLASLRGDHSQAVAHYKKLLQHQPNHIEARFNLQRSLAIVAEQQGDFPKALAALQIAVTIAPQDGQLQAQIAMIARQLCDFSYPTPAITGTLNPAAAMVLWDDPVKQRHNAEAWARQHYGHIKPLPPLSAPRHAGALRVGFLGGDFHEHATAYLVVELFELFDPAQIATYIYSYGIESDAPIRQRLLKACGHFHNIRAQDSASIANQIQTDKIDILIDLKGYTRGGRLDILAYKPAPVQMHWLGFPGTLGCPFIDYFIADSVVLPPEHEAHFSETIIRLPQCYQSNDRQRVIPPALPCTAYGLPDDALVLASFNQTYKLTPALLQQWADILHAVPNSVLWLLASNSTAPDNIRQFFAKSGIAVDRLFFAAPTGQTEHLQRYHAVDIALDTHPIGGHTTTSDALWLGVPVVTQLGESFVSRVAASLLNAAHVPELIAPGADAYHRLAVELGRDHTRRTAIKTTLMTNRFDLPLFDSTVFAKNFQVMLQNVISKKN